MFNYFLVSLALSDMLSAILVMPLSIMRSFVGRYRSFIYFLSHLLILHYYYTANKTHINLFTY